MYHLENIIKNCNIRYKSINRINVDLLFDWYKIDGKEVPLTQEEYDILENWFCQYPLIFNDNKQKDFIIPNIIIPSLRFKKLISQKMCIESKKLRTDEIIFSPLVNYDLDFDIIGYER